VRALSRLGTRQSCYFSWARLCEPARSLALTLCWTCSSGASWK
jgi:hypothetical protein